MSTDLKTHNGSRYIAIDLKSFYASVECVERGLDPLKALLTVADESRTDKTICLAVSPALKERLGIGGRPRLFEVARKARGLSYTVAPPRMALYIDYSTRIYKIYLRFVAPEDIHVYSVDEVFLDATAYLRTYRLTARELAKRMMRAVFAETGITATAGIGTNLYLCKIAMDIVAKKMPPDADGVRIAELDEQSYRRELWGHRPMTDFWRVGRGTADRLAQYGIHTMGDLARFSLEHEAFLYNMFGINAELLIDHAWGVEPVEMRHIKAYRPETRSISNGQVLTGPYSAAMARTVVLEMADSIALELVDKGLTTNQLVLEAGYDVESLNKAGTRYEGRVDLDRYGRRVPHHAHGTTTLARHTSSGRLISEAVAALYDRIVNPDLLLRRLTLTAGRLAIENELTCRESAPVQLDLFTDYDEQERILRNESEILAREHRRQEAILGIKKKFGKNAILRGLNFAEGATQRERNDQIGGHKA